MDKQQGIEKLAKIMKGAHIGSLTTVHEDGSLVSRPMGLQQSEFDGDLWFFTYAQSHKMSEILSRPGVNVTFENSGSWVSISGNANQVDDKAKMSELWNPLLKAWFPDELETSGITLLKVEATSAEYWDSDSPQVVQLFGMIKAAATGKPAKGGENETIEL